MNITLQQAQQAIMAAVKKAEKIEVKQNVAIVDAGANLIAFAHMDNAWLGSIDISMKKAKTARFFDMDTNKIGELSQPGKPLYGIEVTNGGLVSFGGGMPIKDADGNVIGAIGVSGGTVDQDMEVAKAGVEALK
jgi:uncharacterized protein GlcG (DUF336 family)